MKLSVWYETADSFYFLSLVTGPFMINKLKLHNGGLLRAVGKLSVFRMDDEERHVRRKDEESSEK